MKAILQDRYGPPGEVLCLGDAPTPRVRDGLVLVKVRAAAVHADIWHAVRGYPYVTRLMGGGRARPKSRIPGSDMAGVVEEVGANVTAFKPGDEVFGCRPFNWIWINGATFAEYALFDPVGLALKPAEASFEAAASVPTSATIALLNIGDPEGLAGKEVLINGAAGGVGAIALQVCKAAGARVTGVDRAETLDMMRGLGADHVIDYAREDFIKGEETYDLIMDVASTLSVDRCRRVLGRSGRYVPIGHDAYGRIPGRSVFGSIPGMLTLMARARFDRNMRSTMSFKAPDRPALLAGLAARLRAGTLTPVIAETFPLSAAGQALERLAEGRTVGRIVITP